MSAGSRLLRLALVGSLLGGCATGPGELPATLQLDGLQRDFLARHVQRARELEAQESLHAALIEWQLVLAVAPRSGEAARESDRLRREIDRRFSRHLEAAQGASRRSDVGGAQLHLLRALALKPDDRDAIDELRRLEGRRAYASMAAAPEVTDAVESEVDVYTAPDTQASAAARAGRRGTSVETVSPASAPGAEGGGVMAADTRRGLAQMARGEYEAALASFMRAQNAMGGSDASLEKHIAGAREALAEQHYQRGVLSFRSARYDDAVSEFERALQYSPDHHKARFYHSSAKELQAR